MALHVGGKRAALAKRAAAERLTGFPTIYCSAGRRGLEVEPSPGELVTRLGAVRADICAR